MSKWGSSICNRHLNLVPKPTQGTPFREVPRSNELVSAPASDFYEKMNVGSVANVINIM